MSLDNLPRMQIGNLDIIAVIQGGMGVKISGAELAAAVANTGAVGTVASVGLGLFGGFEEEIKANKTKIENASSPEEKKKIIEDIYIRANQTALEEEITIARSKTNGVLALNIMHALSDYCRLVETAVRKKINIIFSGAGVPRDLPKYLDGEDIKLVPIVSSGKLADMMCKAWRKFNHLPDAIVVEGPKAGGHLGYSIEELNDPEFVENGLDKIVVDVINAVKPYETEKKIPVIAGGGIFYGWNMKKIIELGAAGVQIATRLVTTEECDASEEFKKAYLNCKKEDIKIIKSPVGMPGRAINNDFLRKVEAGEKVPTNCPYHCLKPCIPEKSDYCIARALINAQKGNMDSGYAFAGANAWRNKDDVKIVDKKIIWPTVKEIMEKLNLEYLVNPSPA